MASKSNSIYIETSLHIAAREGNAERVYRLAHHNSDLVNRKTAEDGFTPLYLMVENRRYDGIAALLTKNPSILIPNGKDGTTAFNLAARLGEVRILRQFFGHLLNVDCRPEKGFTALYDAVDTYQLEAAKFLIESGADIHSENGPGGETPLHCAARIGNAAFISLVSQIPGSKIDARDKQGCTPLYLAVSAGKLGAVNALLEAGADPFIQCGADQFTPILLAAQDAEIMKRLCQIPGVAHHRTKVPLNYFKSFINIRNPSQSSPPINMNQTYLTPLYCAAQQGNIEAARVLIEAGANVNEINGPYRATALHIAVGVKESRFVEWFCTLPGINLEQPLIDDYTPLSVAVSNPDPATLDCLLKAGADPNGLFTLSKFSPLHGAICMEDIGTVRQLLAVGDRIDKNIKDKDGLTPFHYALSLERYDIADALLTAGADPNEPLNTGITPLQHTVSQGLFRFVRRICEDPRTEIDKKGKEGQSTPFEIAQRNKRLDIAEFLLSKGAKKPPIKIVLRVRSPAQTMVEEARGLVTRKKYPEAKKVLKKASRVDSQNYQVPLMYAQIAVLENDDKEAEKHFEVALHLCEKDPTASSELPFIYSWLADKKFMLDKYEEAKMYYEKGIEVDPKNFRSYSGLGRSYQWLGKFSEAEANFRKALNSDMNNTYTWQNLGDLLLLLKRNVEAKGCYSMALTKDFKNSWAYSGLGSVELRERKIEKAKAYLEQAFNHHKENSDAYCLCGDIALFENQPKKAEEEYLRALKIHPHCSRALLGLGLLEQNRGNVQKAEEYFITVQCGEAWNPESYIRLGRLVLRKDLQKAEDYFRKAVALNKDDPDAKNGLSEVLETLVVQGCFLIGDQKYDEAKRAFAAAKNLDPRNIPALIGLAEVALLQNDIDTARGHFQAALELGCDDGRAQIGLGKCAESQEKLPEARQYYEKALTVLCPNRQVPALAHLGLGRLCLFENNPQEGEKYLLAALHLDSPDIRIYISLGIACRQQGKLKEAEDRFKQALNIKPNDTYILSHLGDVALRQNDLTKALKLFQDALSKDPNNPAAYVGLGDIEIVQHHLKEAKHHYWEALKKDGYNTDALCGLGDVARLKGEFDLSENHYMKAWGLGCRTVRLFIGLAGNALQQKRIDKATEYYEAAQKIEPHNLYVQLGLKNLPH